MWDSRCLDWTVSTLHQDEVQRGKERKRKENIFFPVTITCRTHKKRCHSWCGPELCTVLVKSGLQRQHNYVQHCRESLNKCRTHTHIIKGTIKLEGEIGGRKRKVAKYHRRNGWKEGNLKTVKKMLKKQTPAKLRNPHKICAIQTNKEKSGLKPTCMFERENLGCYCYIPTFCWRNRKLVQIRKTVNQLMSNANIKLRELKMQRMLWWL